MNHQCKCEPYDSLYIYVCVNQLIQCIFEASCCICYKSSACRFIDEVDLGNLSFPGMGLGSITQRAIDLKSKAHSKSKVAGGDGGRELIALILLLHLVLYCSCL